MTQGKMMSWKEVKKYEYRHFLLIKMITEVIAFEDKAKWVRIKDEDISKGYSYQLTNYKWKLTKEIKTFNGDNK